MTKPPTVLIVDDLAFWRVRIKALAESLGFTVITAINGNDACERLLNHPDITAVITDVQMKPGDGIDVLQAIYRMDVDVFPKTLVHSSEKTYTADDGAEWHLTTHVHYYFGKFAQFADKPVDLAEAKAFLEEILAARQ